MIQCWLEGRSPLGTSIHILHRPTRRTPVVWPLLRRVSNVSALLGPWTHTELVRLQQGPCRPLGPRLCPGAQLRPHTPAPCWEFLLTASRPEALRQNVRSLPKEAKAPRKWVKEESWGVSGRRSGRETQDERGTRRGKAQDRIFQEEPCASKAGLSRGSGTRRSRRPADLSLPLGLLCHLLSGSLRGQQGPRPYLHRSAGCRGDGSRACRSTCSCPRCSYTSAGRASPGIRPCLEGTDEAAALCSCGNTVPPSVSDRHLLPLRAVGGSS